MAELSLLNLPYEFIIKILCSVATSSLADLLRVKGSCKGLYEAAENEMIYRAISLEKVLISSWGMTETKLTLLEKCRLNENPESLYREGVECIFINMKYFEWNPKPEQGLTCLRRAAGVGHYKASYILEIIFLCCEDKCKQEEGMELIDLVMKTKKLTESRMKLGDILRNIWLDSVKLEERPNTCPMRNQHEKKEGWEPLDPDFDEISCRECSCIREVKYVCGLFRGR
ncbi:uncharacterized protein LOC126661766 [Mercurialis annua]|uniref:uncharacterized protein LOC126661766 n=1 Tax=Mercurialis annua TaxID=3986 RepID=UPI00215E4290|nr:uncharacterized protein LOC126661766 [Mercurialis annua]